MSTTETCLTAHLLMPGGRPDDRRRNREWYRSWRPLGAAGRIGVGQAPWVVRETGTVLPMGRQWRFAMRLRGGTADRVLGIDVREQMTNRCNWILGQSTGLGSSWPASLNLIYAGSGSVWKIPPELEDLGSGQVASFNLAFIPCLCG